MTRWKLVPVGGDAWGEALERVPHDTYHLPGYARLDAALWHGEAVAFVYEDTRGCFLLPLVLRTIPGSARLDATAPYGYGGPVSSSQDPAFWTDAVAALAKTMREQNVVCLRARIHPLLECPAFQLDEHSALVEHGLTVSIDLHQPDVDIVAQFRQNHRREIRRSRGAGSHVLVDEWSYLGAFVDAYYETLDRLGADADHYFPGRYFDQLRELLGSHCHLMVVVRDSEFLGGGIILEAGGIVQYHLGATRNGARREQPTKLLFDDTWRWAKARGNRDFHLGGGLDAESGSTLFHFKGGFSKRRHTVRSLRLVVDPIAYRLLSRGPRQWSTEALTGFFPAYRRKELVGSDSVADRGGS